MEVILQILLITALLSIIINAVLKKYNVPPIIGYIIAGAVITYLFSLRETSLHVLHDISEFGIAFLMFTIGLEFSIANFKKLKREVFLFGTLQVLLSTLFFGAVAYGFFNLAPKTSVIIGCALALSSTAIILKILNDNLEIRKEYGRIVLGILLFQDLAVIPILLMISFFTTTGVSIETMLTQAAISAALVLIILFLAGKYLLTPFLSFVFDAHSHELFIGSVLVVAIAASYTAYHFGFSYSLGAFIGGMLLAETPFKHQVEADLTPFRDLLLGVFFVTVGMQISIDFMLMHILEIIGLMSAVMLSKVFLLASILYFSTSLNNSFKSAIALSQVGEFSFVVLELARIGGITTKEINQILIIAVVFSMIITPFIIQNLQRIVEWILRSRVHYDEPFSSAGASGHIVVIGYDGLGQEICRQLKSKGVLYIAIDHQRELVDESRMHGDPFILGNAHQQHILTNAHVQNAMAVIITTESDEESAHLVNAVFHMAPSANIVVSTRSDASLFKNDKRIRSFIHEHHEVASSMVFQALTCNMSTYAAEDIQ